ncbi:MAG: tetratricopeptide repeat protein [Verrucomicrobia bacterium]|nr:tetratricopeptide repeat protein [Verrucomicrobiota bacterium]
MSPRVACKLLLLAVLAAGPTVAGQITAGWQALAAYKPAEALKIFDASADSAVSAVAREARFGHAVALLDLQPVSSAALEEARKICADLADSGTDDAAQGGRFFLGRIAQQHQPQPDPEEAARQYRRLIGDHPGSVWAESAITRLAVLQIYALNQGASPAARLAQTEKLLSQARTPSAQSDVHYAIANATFFYRLPAAGALPHLIAAEQLGRMEWPTRIEVLIQIAELSRLAGDRAQAVKYFHTFLQENPRDLRAFVVRQRLAELEKPGA